MSFDLIQTLALAGIVLFVGYGLQRMIPLLQRLNIPAPVIGGLLAAVAVLLARTYELPVPQFDTTLQGPLMIAFFTTIGFSASLSLLKVGGPQVALLLLIASLFAVLQNVVGAVLAMGFGLPPLFGVLTGSVTLTGGPATGLAFAPLFEEAGIVGADSIAIAAAMAGIVLGGLVGGPVATYIINRNRLKSAAASVAGPTAAVAATPAAAAPAAEGAEYDEDTPQTFTALKTVVVVLLAMWIGGGVSALISATGFTLPAYIGAMLTAAAIRNLDDLTGWVGLSHSALDILGAVSLSLFLAMALMTLDLTQLAGLAVPLIVILAVQVLLVCAVCLWPVFQLMGRDYESAVMSGGFIGFMMGTTANAMAVMRTLVERFGAAPRAFLVAPLIGAFFIDFVNALIITGFLNFLSP